MGQGIPPTLIVHVVGTIFYVFSYDAVSDQDSNLSPPPRRTDGLGLLGNLLCIILSKRPVWPGRGSATNINTKKPEKLYKKSYFVIFCLRRRNAPAGSVLAISTPKNLKSPKPASIAPS